jgi:hypothetical protein
MRYHEESYHCCSMNQAQIDNHRPIKVPCLVVFHYRTNNIRERIHRVQYNYEIFCVRLQLVCKVAERWCVVYEVFIISHPLLSAR